MLVSLLNAFLSVVVAPVTSVKSAAIDPMVTVGNVGHGASVTVDAVGGAHNMSIFSMLSQASTVVQLVMVLLLFASVLSWAVIFNKWLRFRSIKRKIDAFEKLFASSKNVDDVLFKVHRTGDDNPLAQILLATFEEWGVKSTAFGRLSEEKLQHRIMSESLETTKECLYQTMQLAANRSLCDLGDGVGILATIGSSSPFIGLFGTVWGIMSNFQAIATAQNVSLVTVAPAISEALLATAFGLVAAIPAVIFYNKFLNDSDKIVGKVEDFQLELSTIILREMCGK